MQPILTTPIGMPVSTITVHKQTAYRISPIDLLRGLVMIIMALDPTRDFFHQYAWTQAPLSMGNHYAASVFHALDHAFLRTGICVPGRHISQVSKPAQTHKRTEPVLSNGVFG